METIDIAPSDPNTIYIGGARTLLGADGSVNRTGIVLASTNGGRATRRPRSRFAAHRVRILRLRLGRGSERPAAGLRAHQPIHRLHCELQRRPAARQRRRRRDISYRVPGAGALPGFALSSDGSKVFLGDSVSGVLLASAPPVDSGAPYSFAQRSPTLVECLTWSAGNLYACAPAVPERVLGGARRLDRRRPDLLSRVPFRLRQRPARLRPDAGALASTCGLEFTSVQAARRPVLRRRRQLYGRGRAGLLRVRHDAGAETSRPRASSCGCEAGEAAGEVGGLSAIGLLVAMVLRRRRRA